MKRIKEVISRIADSPATVLVTGERWNWERSRRPSIHGVSSMAEGPFVAINIGGVPENLLKVNCLVMKRGLSPEQPDEDRHVRTG